MKTPRLSVVVPVYNEEGSLRALDSQISAALEASGYEAEIIYVDDCSTDSSPRILERLLKDNHSGRFRKRLVTLSRNFGQTAALAAGFDLAEGEVTVALDADGQNNPADIPRLLEVLERGFDVVSGWRRRRRDKAISRRLPSWVGNRLISLASGVRLRDHGCTLKAYRSSVLKEIQLHGEMHRYITILLSRIGARITELEVDHRPRTQGESKYGSERILKVSSDLVLIWFMSKYFTRPMHFFGQTAMFLFLLAVLSASLMMVFKFGWLRVIGIEYQASFIQTPMPTLAGTFFVGGITSLFFGILGEILIRLRFGLGDSKSYAIEGIQESGQAVLEEAEEGDG